MTQVKAVTDVGLALHFTEGDEPAMWKTEFRHPHYAPNGRSTVRGKDKGAHEASGAFQWSPAVRVLAAYLLRCAASARRIPNSESCPVLEGGPASPAATLDYALTKQNKWICDMFGSDMEGRPNLLRLLLRSNSGLKRKGEPVVLRLKHDKLPPRQIEVLAGLARRLIEEAEEIERLSEAIEQSWKPKETEESGAVLTLSGSVAKDWTPEKQHTLEQALAKLGIKNCTIVGVEEGSIKLTLKLPPEEAERLFWAVHSGELDELGVLAFDYAAVPWEVASHGTALDKREADSSWRGHPMPNQPGMIRQAAAIPLWNGQVCLVSSRSGKRWVVPKGCMEPGKTAGEVALQEAWEEAGLVGLLQPEPVGTWVYEKDGFTCHVIVFLLNVTDTVETYPESHLRKRIWLSIPQALAQIDDPGLRELIRVVPIACAG